MVRFLTIQALALGLLVAPLFGGNDKNFTYLALGDSIAFGYNPTLFPPYQPASPVPTPGEFVGYPERVADFLHLLQSKKEVNAACPGETSGSFLDVSLPDNGCNGLNGFKNAIGLHTNYTDYTESQASFAASELASNKHIDLVTLSIGGNDLLLLEKACSFNGPLNPPDTACVGQGLSAVLAKYGQHLFDILTAIRANYKGTLVVMTSYVPNASTLFQTAIVALNGTMVGVASSFHVKFADGFTAFQIASIPAGGDPCAAGLLIRLPPPAPSGSCDVHPSPIGRDILALTVLAAH
jgi:lysophospholipase L1-like esterase